MTKLIAGVAGTLVAIVAVTLNVTAQNQPKQLSFFVTSVGGGNGANLGGLAGADKHCQMLAAAAGAGNRTWRAYLSAAAAAGQPAVNARDRIGKGPWYNVKGEMIAKDVADLHADAKLLTKETNLTEKGTPVNGVGDKPNEHDILTGSQADGTLAPLTAPNTDATCGNWTSSDAGSAQVGHSDRKGGGPAAGSWNASHASRGCSQTNLQASGGNGYFYCFAAN